jgi:outer membrane protein assembly factor BamE (lipoprotein component of BamABCDE complex)
MVNELSLSKEKTMKSLVSVAACVLLCSCVYSQHNYDHTKGSSVKQEQLVQIESGKTTKQWVLANLGIPDRTQVDKDGLEVFEYVREKSTTSSKTFIFLFDIKSEKDISKTLTRVVMRNGIVETVTTSNEI